jgi:hypothetical protein
MVRIVDEQVYVVILAVARGKCCAALGTNFAEDGA